jgi:hypothetical protein
MKRILSIIAVIFCCLFLVTAGSSAVAIDDVDCPCGCGMKAIGCLCGDAIKALMDAGFTAEDIEKHLSSSGV